MFVPVADHAHSWKEISKGKWSRPLGGIEAFMGFLADLTSSLFAGREHTLVYSAVKIQATNSIDVKDLQEAWTRMRFQQPNLATTIDISAGTLNYCIPTEEYISQWLTDTFVVVLHTTANELYPEMKPIKNTTLYWLPNSNELILRCPHFKIDGIGTLLFWDDFFSLLSQPKQEKITWGEEIAGLPPTMEYILNYNPIPTEEQNATVQAMVGDYLSKVPGVSPPTNQGVPGECRKLELELDESTTTAIIRASKARGLSVTSAVHAAFALATVEHATLELKDRDYLTFCFFNLRKYLGKFDRMLVPYFALLCSAFPVSSFDDMGQHMNKYYHETYPGILPLDGYIIRTVLEGMQDPEFLKAPVPGAAVLSSYGVVDKYLKASYGDLEIQSLDNSLDIVLGAPLLTIYTFRGRFKMIYSYNVGAQSTEQIQAILNTTLDVLQRELSIPQPLV